jgi:steroid delta-isomerase-like uncharacterized protein
MPTTLSTAELKAIVIRAHDEVINTCDWSQLPDYFTADVIVHAPPRPEPRLGRDALLALFKMVQNAFPDRRTHIEDVFGEGDKVAARWTIGGTHRGDFFGFPGTGKKFAAQELAIYRFEDRKVAEVWFMPDIIAHMNQLGLLPEGPPPRAVLLMMRWAQKLGLGGKRPPPP